jgi:hypothetical protein
MARNKKHRATCSKKQFVLQPLIRPCGLLLEPHVLMPRLPEPDGLSEVAGREGTATSGQNLKQPIIALGDVVV